MPTHLVQLVLAPKLDQFRVMFLAVLLCLISRLRLGHVKEHTASNFGPAPILHILDILRPHLDAGRLRRVAHGDVVAADEAMFLIKLY